MRQIVHLTKLTKNRGGVKLMSRHDDGSSHNGSSLKFYHYHAIAMA